MTAAVTTTGLARREHGGAAALALGAAVILLFLASLAIGRSGLYEPGTYTVGRKAKWPRWTPTPQMIEREPEIYAQYADGMDPGPGNALGSRALYLFLGSRDTYLRIHGTPQPHLLGRAVSKGCIRMRNEDVVRLYARVRIGTPVVVEP